MVVADRAKLQVVLDSLLDNAVKFTPAGGTIAVAAVRDRDQRPSCPSPTPASEFPSPSRKRCSRGSTGRATSQPIPGSGLGLAIVKATVERFGGTVGFESGESGTRFEVRLPV